MSGARIEVFQNDVNERFRQIELSGSPVDIARAAEKIYKIVNKYYFFENEPKVKESDRYSNKKRSRDEDYGERPIKRKNEDRKVRENRPKARLRLSKTTKSKKGIYLYNI